MILARRVDFALTGVGISGDDSELRDPAVQPGVTCNGVPERGTSFTKPQEGIS